jgi:hypothetical protein
MNWISHIHMSTIVLVSADIASIYISALFFSAKVRRWSYRKRWGALPAIATQPDSSALARVITRGRGGDDLSGELGRPRQVNLLRNPFDAKPREALASGTAPCAHRNESRRPTFRKSTALLPRIVQHERIAMGFLATPPLRLTEARSVDSPAKVDMQKPRFEPVFNGSNTQQSQLT